MKFKQLFTDDSAVSPVIGVILMVAITVILAAVIGTFVLNLGQGINQSAPQASFGFDYNTTPSSNGNVTITHETGDSLNSDQVNVSGFSVDSPQTWPNDETISAGSSGTFENGEDWGGETIRVVWTSQNGETSATLSQSTAPTE
ncbi:type IV pilin [Halobellus litoreus]|uniref:Type IV pilin n=1 Tax=Halobellus litoreus TaxID=755310 RepID=A0ABD6DU42_9EURY|nr:type IV pilin N-terminal domain-containing protein [Halobellus litoreus]